MSDFRGVSNDPQKSDIRRKKLDILFFGGRGSKMTPKNRTSFMDVPSESAPEHRVRLTSGRACALRLTMMLKLLERDR